MSRRLQKHLSRISIWLGCAAPVQHSSLAAGVAGGRRPSFCQLVQMRQRLRALHAELRTALRAGAGRRLGHRVRLLLLLLRRLLLLGLLLLLLLLQMPACAPVRGWTSKRRRRSPAGQGGRVR